MIFDEDHEESKTNEHHDIDILIHGVVGLVVPVGDIGINLDEDTVEDDEDNFNDDGVDGKNDLILLLGVQSVLFRILHYD